MNKESLGDYPIFEKETLLSLTPFPKQGYCNLNYRLQTDRKLYHIRYFQHPEIDRALEYRFQLLASQKGIAAHPYLLDRDSNLMIGEHLHGEHRTELRHRELRMLASTLKKLHTLHPRGKALKPRRLIDGHSVKYSKMFRILSTYQEAPVLCHNDLNPGNILFDRDRVKLIDWEYAAINDRYFDLASVCVEFHLNRRDERLFIRSYFGDRHPRYRKKLDAYKFLYSILIAQWFLKEKERGSITRSSRPVHRSITGRQKNTKEFGAKGTDPLSAP
jgi:predicted Ser/Thr protein kinase